MEHASGGAPSGEANAADLETLPSGGIWPARLAREGPAWQGGPTVNNGDFPAESLMGLA